MTDANHPALRVVIHAPSENALARARANAANLRAIEPDAEIEIVVNGPAVAAALATPDATDSLLRVCKNTLQRLNRDAPPEIRTVQAAVQHIVRRQAQGWAYLRA